MYHGIVESLCLCRAFIQSLIQHCTNLFLFLFLFLFLLTWQHLSTFHLTLSPSQLLMLAAECSHLQEDIHFSAYEGAWENENPRHA